VAVGLRSVVGCCFCFIRQRVDVVVERADIHLVRGTTTANYARSDNDRHEHASLAARERKSRA
jgi:hypothetical protein